jgi:hypothetical protein
MSNYDNTANEVSSNAPTADYINSTQFITDNISQILELPAQVNFPVVADFNEQLLNEQIFLLENSNAFFTQEEEKEEKEQTDEGNK